MYLASGQYDYENDTRALVHARKHVVGTDSQKDLNVMQR